MRALRVETTEQDDPWRHGPRLIELEVVPPDAKGAAALRALHRERGPVRLAYGDDAFEGAVREARQLREGGDERWRIEFEPAGNAYGGYVSEVATDGYTADEIAALRARWILLDERPPGRPRTSSLADFVSGMTVALRVQGSPFPLVHRAIGARDVPRLLAGCRLAGVLWLRLSGTVEEVWRLELALGPDGSLAVGFEGRRRTDAVNTEPSTIRVEGTCPLVGSAGPTN